MGAEQIISLVTETVSTQVFGVWFLIGGNRLHQSQKRGQYYYEEPDGLLHWHSGVRTFGLQPDDGRGLRDGLYRYT